MNRYEILAKAGSVINGDRDMKYGKPEDNFSRIADFWNIYLAGKYDIPHCITPVDVGWMMILLKVARDMHARELDNLVDVAGYAACVGEITSNA